MLSAQRIEFTADASGERLDKLIVAEVGDELSRSQIQALIRDGQVTVNDAPAKAGMKLKGGEKVLVNVPLPAEDHSVEPEIIPLDVLYEDDDLAVINKPAGLIVHPGAGNETGTLVNAILARFPEIAAMSYAPKRRGIVHRLDKDTSGVILVARRAPIMRQLMEQFQARTVQKTYLALVEKTPRTQVGRIEAPITRDSAQRKRMAVRREGRPAVTEFAVVEQFKTGQALLKIKLLTGRTHQIRVHMTFIGCPVVGDRLYGFRKQRIPLRRQFLHAAELCFDHPRTGERLCFESPLPDDLQAVLEELRR